MPKVIEAEGLTKTFGDLVAVGGIDLAIEQGECVGFLGPNGAGKTTTMEILEGLQEPTTGTVRLFGKTWKEGGDALRQRLGIQLQQTVYLNGVTVEEILYLFRSFYPGAPDPEKVLDGLQLGEKRKALYKTLSGGQKQRLSLAVALLADPEIVFLDEPTTGLDPHARRALWEVVLAAKRAGKTILLTTHYMEEAEQLCDRLLVIDRGKVVAQGTSQAIIGSLEGSDVVEITTVPEVPADVFLKVDGVVGKLDATSGLKLAVSGLARAVPGILAAAKTAGADVTQLSTRRLSLDDAFLRITGHSLREGT